MFDYLLNFLIGEVGTVAIDGMCVGFILSYLIPADPANLPRTVAWLQANKDPKPGSSIPLRPYHWAVSLGGLGIIAYTQYLVVRYLVLFPTWVLAYGQTRFVWFAFDEVAILGWIAYLIYTFRRAAKRSK